MTFNNYLGRLYSTSFNVNEKRNRTMKASTIRLKELTNAVACFDAIEEIKNDYRNHYGGLKAWNSGYDVYLTDTAEKKIAAIRAKIDRLMSDD